MKKVLEGFRLLSNKYICIVNDALGREVCRKIAERENESSILFSLLKSSEQNMMCQSLTLQLERED